MCSSLKTVILPFSAPPYLTGAKHHTGRQTTSDDLLIGTDFNAGYTAALHIPGKTEYVSR